LQKRSKVTLISRWSLGRATSADIGRKFRPLRLVWRVLWSVWYTIHKACQWPKVLT